MKKFLIQVTAGLLFLSVVNLDAGIAQVRLHCWSLQFQQGSDSFGSTLDLSTVDGAANGELAPYSGNTWGSFFSLDYLGGYPITGTIYVDLPPYVDANSNGFDDFFEVSQGVNASTTGTYKTAIGGGTVTASWNRGAGVASGTCVVDLKDNTYGDLGNFRLNFQVLEYTGPLTYTPGSNTVAGVVDLNQTGNPANTFQGPVTFVKSSTNRFDALTLQAGSWTNAAAATLNFDAESISRNPTWPTNYYGYFDFDDDGNPNTFQPYSMWELSIDDNNDANGNGVPDFSDDPAIVAPPSQPVLALSLASTNLLLTIQGDPNHSYLVQASDSLIVTNWQTVATVALTNKSEVMSLPLPTGSRAFWRLLAQ